MVYFVGDISAEDAERGGREDVFTDSLPYLTVVSPRLLLTSPYSAFLAMRLAEGASWREAYAAGYRASTRGEGGHIESLLGSG